MKHPSCVPIRGGSAVSQAAEVSAAWATIAEVDPDLWTAMEAERHRQADKIELIASENYVHTAVLEAQGSWLTNKYAEGLPGKRYYGGCEFVDIVEDLARARALALFPGSEHVNVQPHSGAQANMAAYFSVLKPGDRILGMNLAHGGHLTHGMALNFSGKLYEVHAYGVRQDTERIDYDAMEAQAREVRPKMIVGGASAYPRLWDFERMADIAHSVGAVLFIDMAHIAGLVAAGVHPSPFPHADIVTTTTHKTLRGPRGGTDNHLMLVDVTPLGVTGKEAEHLLDEIGITVNKNGIPFDPLPPNTASGIRLGTPATTSRGFGEDEMRSVGRIIIEAIRSRDEPATHARLAGEVSEIVSRLPVPSLPAA